MFQGFQARRSEDGIAMRVGGDGPPLLLLHGYPQTHVMWHGVAPHLAHDFTVVVADLPGYGDSEPPQAETDHTPHSKRAWAFRLVTAWRRPATVQAMCEDYRAGFGIDSDLDRADRAAGRRITAPLLALWASRGVIGVWYDPLALWSQWADDVSGGPVDATHFLAEDRPHEVAHLLGDFFG